MNMCHNCQKQTKNRRFCSRSCSATFFNKNPTKKIIDGRKKLTKKCLNCSNLIPIKNTFCSQDCRKNYGIDARKSITEKICPKCNKLLSIKHFYWSKIAQRYQTYCRPCNLNDSIRRLHLFKQKCVEYKGGKCERCGYNKYLGALEFHHIDPSQKDPDFVKYKSNKSCKSFELMKNELDKCICLCSNCHREIHHELRISVLGVEPSDFPPL